MPQDSPEAKAWRARIGGNFVDFFHFCAGLNYVNRYWGAHNALERDYYLNRAKANFTYIENALKPDFTMGAELYSNRGEVYKLMGKPGEAIKDFHRAISIDPAIVKPYLQLADLQAKSDSPARALETITDGLRHAPDSKKLQRRYLELGGKTPFPAPIAAKPVDPESPPPAVLTPAPETASEPVSAQQPAAEPAPASPSGSAVSPIGNTKNPYCRFCPPE